MLTLNQYILLDPILLCFMTASVWGMVKVSKSTHLGQAFRRQWWLWLLFTGTMLACTISVKFVGLFVVLLVGLHTVNDLWLQLADLSKPVVRNYLQFFSPKMYLLIIIVFSTILDVHGKTVWSPCLNANCMANIFVHVFLLHPSGCAESQR